MTAYDTSDLEGVRVGFGNVKTHLDAMRVRTRTAKATSTSSTSSSSFAALQSETLTGVVASELIEVSCFFSVSGGTIADQLEYYIDIGGSQSASGLYIALNSSSLGTTATLSGSWVATGLSGSVVCSLQWRRSGGTGTLYCARRTMTIKRMRDGGAA